MANFLGNKAKFSFVVQREMASDRSERTGKARSSKPLSKSAAIFQINYFNQLNFEVSQLPLNKKYCLRSLILLTILPFSLKISIT